MLNTVTRGTASKGKSFWRCSNPDGCGFFNWADEGVGSIPNVSAKRPYSTVSGIICIDIKLTKSIQTQDLISDGAARMCKCNQAAILFTVVKESANKGRKFGTCRKDDRCGFYVWDDEPPQMVSQGSMASRAESFNARNGPAASDDYFRVWTLWLSLLYAVMTYIFCVIKRATGPLVSDQAMFCLKCYMLTSLFETLECPNEGNNSNKRPKNFGTSMNDNITGTCYKCQEAGHYASGQCSVFGAAHIANLIFLA